MLFAQERKILEFMTLIVPRAVFAAAGGEGR